MSKNSFILGIIIIEINKTAIKMMTASGDTADPILTYNSLPTSDPDEFENPSVQTQPITKLKCMNWETVKKKLI